ncbi:MAG: ATP-dependent DNA helicase RecQ, partial [Planctomycetota bacterium]
MEPQTLSVDLDAALKQYFGMESFREGQKDIIETALRGVPVLAILPTGGGKSLCYQLPALLSEGVSLVISPLIALMKDQIDVLVERGLPATFINSSLSMSEYKERMQGLAENKYKIVYVSPERFRNAPFRQALQGLKIAVFAIDEAHCISYWGHDFRPDYRRLGKAIDSLKPKSVIALTATATEEVQQDILNQLNLPYMERFVAGFDRKNLMLQVISTDSTKEKFSQLERLLSKEKGSVIVYCATRKNTEKVAEHLFSKKYRVACYHGGMEDSLRTQVQDEFMSTSKLQVVVATNAFGMGIDKHDIRQVIHYDIPGTIEAYYQEAGRAGRDGLPSVCTVLFQYADKHILEFFIEGSHPSQEIIEELYAALLKFNTVRIETPIKELLNHVKSAQNEMAIYSSLKILEEAGLIERTHRNENLCGIVLQGTMKDILFKLRKASGHRVDLLRFFQNEYDFTEGLIQLPPQELIQNTGLTEEQLKRALGKLVEERLIQYIPPQRGRGIL